MGLADQSTEIRLVNGGKAVRASARRNQGIPTLYSYTGVEFPYAGRETGRQVRPLPGHGQVNISHRLIASLCICRGGSVHEGQRHWPVVNGKVDASHDARRTEAVAA